VAIGLDNFLKDGINFARQDDPDRPVLMSLLHCSRWRLGGRDAGYSDRNDPNVSAAMENPHRMAEQPSIGADLTL